MDRQGLLEFVRRHALAVQASVNADRDPQAAVIGIVTDDRLEIFFDTLASSRKCENLRKHPRIALVIGWELEEACTVQLEGDVDEPRGPELEHWKRLYFARFPDGALRQSWPGISYFRVRPTWARFSDFRTPQPTIVELSREALALPRG